MKVEVALPPWRKLLVVLVAGAVAVAMLNVVGAVAGSSLLSATEETNLPTWLSSAQFLLAGVACLVAASYQDNARPWLALALVLTAFSADEIAMFHERIETRAGAQAVILATVPVLAAGGVAMARSLRGSVSREGALLLFGAAVSIVLAQAAGACVEVFDITGVGFDVLAIAEELLELLTGALALTAAVNSVEGASPRRTRSRTRRA